MLRKCIDMLMEHIIAAIAVTVIAFTGALLSPQMETITKAFETKPREMTLWTVIVTLVGFVIGYSGLLKSKKAEKIQRIKNTCKTLSRTQKALLLQLLNEGTIMDDHFYDLDLLLKVSLIFIGSITSPDYKRAVMINPDAIDILQRHRTDWIGEMSEKEIVKILNG